MQLPNYLRISRKTAAYIIFILVGAALFRPALEWSSIYLPRRAVIGVGALFLFAVVLREMLSYSWRALVSIGVVLIAAGLGTIWLLPIPEERIHIVQYGVMSWLLARDYFGYLSRKHALWAAIIIAALLGILDEGIQSITPGRYADPRDIGLNALGAVIGGIVCLCSVRADCSVRKT